MRRVFLLFVVAWTIDHGCGGFFADDPAGNSPPMHDETGYANSSSVPMFLRRGDAGGGASDATAVDSPDREATR